jgi:hypothetical protein
MGLRDAAAGCRPAGQNLYAALMARTTDPARIFMPGRAFDCSPLQSGPAEPGEVAAMLDFLMIAYGAGFFAAAILYVLACERM